LPADHYEAVTPVRPPPKLRAVIEPVKRKTRVVFEDGLRYCLLSFNHKKQTKHCYSVWSELLV